MNFKKSTLACILGVSLAFSVSAVEKQHQTITIEANDNEAVKINIVKNDDKQVFTVSQAALKDPDLLSIELAGADQETITHLTKVLSNLHQVGEHQVMISIDDNSSDDLHEMQKVVKKIWVTEDGNDGDLSNIDEEHMIIFDTDGEEGTNMPFNVLKHLLSKSELTKDQLDDLQNIIDSKR